MNSTLYQEILKEDIQSSVCKLKLKCNWIMKTVIESIRTSPPLNGFNLVKLKFEVA